MPNYKTVYNLEDIVLIQIKKWLLKCSNISNSNKLNAVKQYLDKYLNQSTRQKLIDFISKTHVYLMDFSQKAFLLEICLNNISTTALDLSEGGFIFVNEVFHLYRILSLIQCSNLQKVSILCSCDDFNDQKYVLEINSLFYSTLNTMKNLKWLTLQGLGETELLETIGKSCHHLEYLDVRRSWHMNDKSVISLIFVNPEKLKDLEEASMMTYCSQKNPCCCTLKFFGVGGTEVTSLGIILSLINLPNLKSFGGSIDANSIKNLISIVSPTRGKYQLTEIWADFLSEEAVLFVDSNFPKIITLNTSIQSINFMLLFNNLNITTLILDLDFKDFESELFDYLYYKGSILETLIFKYGINCFVDLSLLMEYTPCLKTLEDAFIKSDSNSNSIISQWENLRTAKIHVNSVQCLKKFLTHTSEIEKLTIKYVDERYSDETTQNINDEFIVDILNSGALKNLEYLDLENCSISELGLVAILSNCHCIRHLEKLYYWKNLTKEAILRLKNNIKSFNWDLEIILISANSDIVI